jgi:hypothetical protein
VELVYYQRLSLPVASPSTDVACAEKESWRIRTSENRNRLLFTGCVA